MTEHKTVYTLWEVSGLKKTFNSITPHSIIAFKETVKLGQAADKETVKEYYTRIYPFYKEGLTNGVSIELLSIKKVEEAV